MGQASHQIRRFLYRRPVPFRTVRDLGLVNARCPCESGAPEGCSSPWIPAWLPTDDSVTPWPSSPSPGLFPATWPRPVLSQAAPTAGSGEAAHTSTRMPLPPVTRGLRDRPGRCRNRLRSSGTSAYQCRRVRGDRRLSDRVHRRCCSRCCSSPAGAGDLDGSGSWGQESASIGLAFVSLSTRSFRFRLRP